jgi:hypothetical protein
VGLAVSNCRTIDGKIRCPCKMCQNNRLHSPDYEHLIAGRGMMTSYINWWHHGQMKPYNPDATIRSNHSATNAVGGSTEEGGDMHAMLGDAFGMHEVREENRGPRGVEQLGEENLNVPPVAGGAQRYYDMLKKAEKPLHEDTKHSKLSVKVRIYSLKCVGGFSNNIFSAFLELINQLLSTCEDSLPANMYGVKKYLSDMGLGYEKIPACHNDCMLFWKSNGELESSTVCGESK